MTRRLALQNRFYDAVRSGAARKAAEHWTTGADEAYVEVVPAQEAP